MACWKDDDDADGATHRSSVNTRKAPPFLPFVLIAIGVAALADDVLGNGIGVWTLLWGAVGVWCLARARDDGPYPLLVIGAFIVGGTIGEILGAFVSRGVSDAMETLGHAGGFFWLYANDRGRSRWAMIAGAIFGVIGISELGFQLTDVVNDASGGWLLPAGVVVAGVLLLGAHRLPGPIRLAGLIFVAAAVLSLITNGGDGDGRRRVVDDNPRPIETVPEGDSHTLGDVAGKTVKVDLGSGDITLSIGDQAIVEGNAITIDQDDDEVTIESANGDIDLTLPAGTSVELETGSGDIDADLGAVVDDMYADLKTGSGSIDVSFEGNPTVDADTGNGDILADGLVDRDDDENEFHHNGSGASVEIETGNGDINIDAGEPVGAGAR